MKAEAQGSGVLSAIVADRRASLAARQGERGAWERRAAAAPSPPSFAAALRGAGGVVALIAEVKRRSPSAGSIREGADALALASSYAAAGAAAISVLTETERFGGSLGDLERVSGALPIPTLCKDFIVDPLQLYEARAAGAAAVLLIARALDDRALRSLASLAHDIGLATLLEVHTAGDLHRALDVGPTAVGVNARDLETLAVEPERHEVLLPMIPPFCLRVAESGLASRGDVERVAASGADAVLVGTVLARADDPGAVARGFVGVRRPGRGA